MSPPVTRYGRPKKEKNITGKTEDLPYYGTGGLINVEKLV